MTFVHAKHHLPEKKIIIIIPSYNNPIEFTRACLTSALTQDYSNFEIIFSDDCSPQENIEQLHKELIAELDIHKRVTYHRNKKRLGPLGNRWNTIHSVNPDNIEDNRTIIIANLDGDDILLCKDALKIINQLHEKAWTTWGSYSILPSTNAYCACQPVPQSVIKHNNWRSCSISLSHIQTYRLSLLKDLPLYTYLWNGNFYPAATDLQSIWGCCEKSQYRTAFNTTPIYGYRLHQNNEMNKPEGTLGAECLAHARAQKPFEPLSKLPFQKPLDSYYVDLIIFSDNNPQELETQLKSIETKLSPINKIFILYQVDTKTQPLYTLLQSNYSEYNFIKINTNSDIKSTLIYCLMSSPHEFVTFLNNKTNVQTISFQDCIRALLKTHGHVFYTALEQLPTSNIITIDKGIVAWDFALIDNPNTQTQHSLMHFFNLTLFTKKVITDALSSMNRVSSQTLEKQWNNYSQTLLHNIGLSFDVT